MQWLQALDTALFHFINGSLGNPFFDWLMPLLSGGDGAMSWFVLAIIAGYIVALILRGADFPVGSHRRWTGDEHHQAFGATPAPLHGAAGRGGTARLHDVGQHAL